MSKNDWKPIAENDQGDCAPIGGPWNKDIATVYRNRNGNRFKLILFVAAGDNQGYFRQNWAEPVREYRANTLPDLMTVALAAENKRPKQNHDIIAAIRVAIGEADDVVDNATH